MIKEISHDVNSDMLSRGVGDTSSHFCDRNFSAYRHLDWLNTISISIYEFWYKEWVELLVNVPINYFIHVFDSNWAIVNTLLFIGAEFHIDRFIWTSQFLNIFIIVILFLGLDGT